MNTEMADGAAQRCVAQIGEALFGQPGMTLVEIANRRAEIEALVKNAARWRHARMLFSLDDIEGRSEDLRSFDYFADEEENERADGAIDAAIAAMKEQDE